MSEQIPASMRPIPKKTPPEYALLGFIGGLMAVAGVAVVAVGLNIGNDSSLFTDEFDIEDLAQKIAVTVVGVGLGIVGFIAIIVAIATSTLHPKLSERTPRVNDAP